jgi:hypothetical protein
VPAGVTLLPQPSARLATAEVRIVSAVK